MKYTVDETYTRNISSKSNKWLIGTLLAVLIAAVSLAGFLYLREKNELVSPVPSEPAFEIIFYTPTPEVVSPTASPSAVMKMQSRTTASPKPSPKATGTPSVKITLTVTPKLSP